MGLPLPPFLTNGTGRGAIVDHHMKMETALIAELGDSDVAKLAMLRVHPLIPIAQILGADFLNSGVARREVQPPARAEREPIKAGNSRAVNLSPDTGFPVPLFALLERGHLTVIYTYARQRFALQKRGPKAPSKIKGCWQEQGSDRPNAPEPRRPNHHRLAHHRQEG